MFIVYDTEDNSPELLSAGKSGFDKRVTQIAAMASNGDTYYNRGNAKEFLHWVSNRPEPFIYAHNAQYDLGNIVGDIIRLDNFDTVFVGNRLIKATGAKKIWRDSMNIWPMSVKKLAPAFGMAKLPTDVNSKEYVFQDVKIVHAAITFAWQFCQLLDIEYLPSTLGGLCVAIWQAWQGTNCHDSNPLCRSAYYGGRVELFKAHSESHNVCYTDINSLYPYVMTFDYPTELEPWTERKLPAFGVIDATVEIPFNPLPVLPYRDEQGRVTFPCGIFRGVWTIAELQYALEQGAKLKHRHCCYGTNDCSKPYQFFVNRLYTMRLESQSEAEKLFFKLLMNNLYGRLGTTGKIWRTCNRTEKNESLGVPFGSKVLCPYNMPLDSTVNWCHAAYVTAYGRITLHKYLKLIGVKSLIYCDTDSAIFDAASKVIPFETGKALGQMKLEGWESNAVCYAPKCYSFGEKHKAKGVRQDKARDFNLTGHASFDLPFRYRESIRFYDRGDIRKLSVWRTIEKFRQSKYDKKKRKKNSFLPLTISDV